MISVGDNLILITEECAELLLEIAKAQRFGFDSKNPLGDGKQSNKERIIHEALDLNTVLVILLDSLNITVEQVEKHTEEKIKKILKWKNYKDY